MLVNARQSERYLPPLLLSLPCQWGEREKERGTCPETVLRFFSRNKRELGREEWKILLIGDTGVEAHLGRMYEASRKVSRLFASTSLFKRGRDLDK